MAFNKIRYTLDGKVAIVALADPATLNAASLDLIDELRAAITRASGESRALLLTGEGRGFCSGANLTAGLPEGGAGGLLEKYYNPLVLALRDLPIPFLTAINGPAAGFGCALALTGDLIIAAESAYFLQAFSRIGLAPDGGSTYLLPRMIGRARAMEMMMLGEKIPAVQALDWGMINRCVADEALMPTALALARKLAEGPKSLTLLRKAAWASFDNSLEDQLALECKLQEEAAGTKDFIEGVTAFLQKRPAKFSGA
jgi:2-(1,2-epoxy-1,2-dihydrophenyl)acetyl-CoA isomerase